MDYKTIRERVEENLTKIRNYTIEAKLEELFRASALTINELLKEKRESFDRKVTRKGKRVHYLCMEFWSEDHLKQPHNLELVEEFVNFAECGYDLKKCLS